MTNANQSSNDSRSSTCPICCEPINPAAKRCNACGTRLDRSDLIERLSATSTVLAVLTALISVITVGLPALVKSLSPNVSHINAAFVRTGSDYPDKYKFDYQIFISNSGNRPGALGEVWVRSDSPNTTDKIKLDIPEHYWPKDTEGIQKLEVLAPGESRSLYFKRRQTGAKLPERAVVVVNVIEFDGTAKIIELQIPPIPTKQALNQSS